MDETADPVALHYEVYYARHKPIFRNDNNHYLISALSYCNREKVSIRVSACGTHYRTVYCNDGCKSKFILVQRCNQNFCRYCSSVYAQRLKKLYIQPVINHHLNNKDKRYRFMFLTLTSSHKPTNDLPRKLLKDARKLFTTLYPGPDQGAVYKLDIGSSGNIHLHCIVYGKYIPQQTISDLWNHIHGSPIVHIEACKSPNQAANYCSKYLSKTTDIPDIDSMSDPSEYENSAYFIGLCCLLKGTVRTQIYRATGIFFKLRCKRIKLKSLCPICGNKVTFGEPILYEDDPPINLALYRTLEAGEDPPFPIQIIFKKEQHNAQPRLN